LVGWRSRESWELEGILLRPIFFFSDVDMNRPSVRRRAPPAAAFTLVEALVSITITAIAASVLLLGIESSLRTTDEGLEQTIATGMAQQLLDELVGAHDRDQIDAYDGLRKQPPVDRWGIELGKDDGEGGERHPLFRAPEGFFDRWRQEIDVHCVSESALTTPLADGVTSDYRLVEVRITYDDPERGRRELAKLRRIVAYVQPLE